MADTHDIFRQRAREEEAEEAARGDRDVLDDHGAMGVGGGNQVSAFPGSTMGNVGGAGLGAAASLASVDASAGATEEESRESGLHDSSEDRAQEAP